MTPCPNIVLSEHEELGFLKNIILLAEIDPIVYCPNSYSEYR